ncbi:sensor histidine kinase [Streptomyces bungoensis]|uniref:sensor histidine kinase n=1 Tax=Streptomyces bungoensis TaxID=285568 RepID=UPI0007C721F5|nr:ATP-binding protein [Streptomyces bungoensis]
MQEPFTLPAPAPQEEAVVGVPAWHVPDMRGAGYGKTFARHLVLLAMLPAGLVAATGAVAVALLATAGVAHVDRAAFWGLLTGALVIVCAVLLGAGLSAAAKARTMERRYTEVSGFAARGQAELAWLRTELARTQELLERQRHEGGPVPGRVADALDGAAEALVGAGEVLDGLEGAAFGPRAAQASARETAAGPHGGEHFEVFANMARRLESLVHREIGLLDDLENEVEDPALLKGLFRVDHLATRIRRYAENLAVLGGAVSHRLWTQPVSMADVMRSAAAEIEQYARVKMVPPVEGTVRGHAVVDVVHLLAELVENATVFSPPHTQVLLRAEHVTAGLAIEVEDRGLGMDSAERNRMNSLLDSPDAVTLDELLTDGRIGLYVVSALARRHGIAVRLQNNVYGGTQAVVVLPYALLGGPEDTTETRRQPPGTGTPAPNGPTPPPAHDRAADAAGAAERVRETVAVAVRSRGTQPPADTDPAAPADLDTVDTVAPESHRPSLPKRRRQEHLAPELRHAPPAEVPAEEADHDPGLMAAFRTGVRRAEETEHAEDAEHVEEVEHVEEAGRPAQAPTAAAPNPAV